MEVWNQSKKNVELKKALDLFLKMEARKVWDFIIRRVEENLIAPEEVTTEVATEIIIEIAIEVMDMRKVKLKVKRKRAKKKIAGRRRLVKSKNS